MASGSAATRTCTAPSPVSGVIDYGWNCCTTTEGGFVDAPEGEVALDSWRRHLNRGTHRALVTLYPAPAYSS